MKIITRKFVVSILIIITIAAVSAVMFFAAGPPVLSSSANRSWESDDIHTAAQRYFRLSRIFPWSSEAREGILRLLSSVGDDSLLVHVGPNFVFTSWTSAHVLPKEYHEQLFDLADRTAAAQANPLWNFNINERMGDALQASGDLKGAAESYEHAMNAFMQRDMFFRVHSLAMKLFDIRYDQGEYRKAGELLALAESAGSLGAFGDSEIIARKGMLSLADRDFEAASRYFLQAKSLTVRGVEDAAPEEHARNIIIEPEAQEGYRIAQRGIMLLEMEVSNQASSSIFGRVQAEGNPISGVIITLIPAGETSRIISTRELAVSNPQTAADNDGNYRFSNITPGHYSFMLSFTPKTLEGLGSFEIPPSLEVSPSSEILQNFSLNKRISITDPSGYIEIPYGDEISLSWGRVDGAARYLVGLQYFTGPKDEPYRSTIGVFIGETEKPEFKIRTAEERNPLEIYSDDRIIPSSAMGAFHPGALVTLRVTALTDEGKTITDSEGLIFDRGANYPLWKIGEPEDPSLLLKGDRLLLAGDIDGAYEAYQVEAGSGSMKAAASLEALKRNLDFIRR